ncbi:serine hydrolase domain-containing protein [Henriciella aquimarina]|uniref:serine hydrolase domain-containing protein n=1 Tax=Henriciella aquimarina TaxID=545261 RepID=UPI000A04A146|nr:serine hydrolase domain-containing protein [Henriciella aquimarina]
MTIQDEITAADVGLNEERLAAIPHYFAGSYLDSGKLPCMATLVSRNGQVVHEAYRGKTQLDGGQPITPDTIFRIYSMTKPITSVAAMMLFEEAKLRLDHEVARYIPEFADTEVWVKGTIDDYETRKPTRPMTVRDLFTHTSGLTYGFLMQHEVDALYRREKIARPDETLEEMCVRLAKLPLLFSPGTRWNYGHSTDVLGRIVEVASGQTLDEFFRERIFEPLNMPDTDFYVPEGKLDRLMACYSKDPVSGKVTLSDGAGAESKQYRSQPPLLNAGGGLVSTFRDYHRFCLMLLHGGTLEGARLLSPKTIEFMRKNHLPENRTIKAMGDKTFSEARMEGNGFGLGGSVITDVAESMQPGSLGTFSWGGLANTFFWIDYEEELIAIQATQMIPSGCYPIRPQFQQLVYAAIDW